MSASVSRRLQNLLKAVEAKDASHSYGKASKIAACRDCVSVKGKRSSQEHIKGLLLYIEEISLKPRGSRSEFIVLSHHKDNDLNKENCISVIMEVAHMAGNAACLEQILQDNKQFPGSGYVMINLGVLFCDNVSYDKAKACFRIAKSWFEQKQQHLHTAIANLNLAILYKVLGQIQQARQYCYQTVKIVCGHHMEQEICVDLIRLLRTSVFTMKELELPDERVQEVLTKSIHMLSKVTDEGTSSVRLTRWLMAILLKQSSGVKVPKEEVVRFFEALYAPLGRSDEGCFVDAGFLKAICFVSRILDDPDESYTLLKQVEASFLQAFGPKHCLVGLLLNQVGDFYLGTGKIEDGVIALTQAEEILIASFGRNHPTVASCQLSLGTCVINKGNRRLAFVLLNQAMTVFNKINPQHPQVAEILLKLAELYVEDGKKMESQETVKQALDIIESICSKVCSKTAGGYFEAGAILKMAEACPTSVHISYHSFKCCDNHKADVVFGNMLSQLPNRLDVAVQQVSLSKNMAFFLLQEPKNSMVSVFRKKEWIMVKGRFPPGVPFTSSISNSLAEALELIMDSMSDLIEEKSSSLCCEETSAGYLLIEKEFSSICGSVEDESGSLCSLPSVTVESRSACDKSLNCKSAEVGWHDAAFSEDKCQEGSSDVFCSENKWHSEIRICLSLLEVLLYNTNNPVVESLSDLDPDVAGHASNRDLNSSFSLLPGSAASLNSYASFNYTNDYLTQHDERTEANSTEQVTLVSDTLGQTCSPVSAEGSPLSCLQHINQTVELIRNSSEECKRCFNDSQESKETVEEALLARNHMLENEVSVMQHKIMELRYQVDLMEQQLKQAEVAKVDTLSELGRLLFSEEKKKRNRAPLALSRGCGSFVDYEVNGSCSVSTKSDERLLGGAAHRWQGKFGFVDFQQRLLDMAHSLSGQDLSSMKTMLKGRVSGFRLARIRHVSQLFEELLYREESPVDVIKELLAGIGRKDLLDKLGILSCGVNKEGPEQYRESAEIQETALPELTENNQYLSEPTRIDSGWSLTSEILVDERGEDFIEPYLGERNLQSYEEEDSTQLKLRKLEDIREILVSSGERSNTSDILSSNSSDYTVDEELSQSWKCSSNILFTNGNGNAHVRSSECHLAAADDGGLVEGRLLDFEHLHSVCVSSENYSSDAGANWAVMQRSSNKHAPLCKCSKVPGKVTADKISDEKIPMNSLLSEGNSNRATDVLEGKELLIELDGGKQVQNNDFAFCSELQDPSETENALEQVTGGGVQSARGGELNEKGRVSDVPGVVPFSGPYYNGMPVTLPGIYTQRGNTGDETIDSKRKHGASGISSPDREGTGRSDELLYRMEDNRQSQCEASCLTNDSYAAAAAALKLRLPSNTSGTLSVSTDDNTRTLANVEQVCGVSSTTTRDNVEGRNDVFDTHARPTHFDSKISSHVISTGEVFSDSISPCSRPKGSSILGWHRYIANVEMESFTDGEPCNDIRSVPTTNNTLCEREGSCSGSALISTLESDSRLCVSSRPKKRSDTKKQQIQEQRSSDDHSPETKSNTAAFGVVSAFLARHSQDESLHHSPEHGVSDDWMQKDSYLEEAAYMEDAELSMMAVSDSTWPVASVGEYQGASVNDPPSGMHMSSLYELRGARDCSVVQNNWSAGTQYHFSAEHSNFNTGQFSRPLLNYNRDYSAVNNDFVWNASNYFLEYSYGNDHTQGGFSPVEGCGMDHHAPVNVFPGPGMGPSEPVLDAERNQIGLNSSFFDTFMGQDTTIQPVHCIVADNYYGVNETSSNTTFQDVSGENSRTLPSYSLFPCSTERNATYLESESTGVPLGRSPDWPDRFSNTRRTELVGSDRSSSRARRSLSPLHFHANHSAPNVIPRSRTERGTMTDHCVGSLLNRDSGDSPTPADTSLLVLEQRVAEACELVERVLRGREDLAERELERRERERREREAAKRHAEEQQAIPGGQQWLCEHYQRRCRVRFPCCQQFYPCHRCHNRSAACPNDDKKASHATHMKCSKCEHEQEINDGSKMCCNCGEEMSAYFCPICKHFTGVDKNPYHCKKCGICRIHKDRSFHCEVCNVCLDKRLQGKHKCRPDSGHDECCICLEDAFGGCQILPCSHKVHRECAIAMIENGIRNCPICRHPLYTPASSS